MNLFYLWSLVKKPGRIVKDFENQTAYENVKLTAARTQKGIPLQMFQEGMFGGPSPSVWEIREGWGGSIVARVVQYELANVQIECHDEKYAGLAERIGAKHSVHAARMYSVMAQGNQEDAPGQKDAPVPVSGSV